MSGGAYYNEFDPRTAEWLRWLIARGLVAPGEVDTRSITEVQPDDLIGFTQAHFFAGIGGWSYAARLAGWPDDRPLWTGSCPCQPFSQAGKGRGTNDVRHLWPDFIRLIRARRPAVVMGEQVAGKAGYGWLDGVRADLARENYASRGVDIPSCAVDAPHIRSRLYWCAVADADGSTGQQITGGSSGDEAPHGRAGRIERKSQCDHRLPSDDESGLALAHPESLGGGRDIAIGRPEGRAADGRADAERGDVGHAVEPRLQGLGGDGSSGARRTGPGQRSAAAADGGGDGELVDSARVGRREGEPELFVERGRYAAADTNGACAVVGHNSAARSAWSDADWINCHDGKARRVADADAPLLVDGFPNRVVAWRGFGDAINPVLAAEVIAALAAELPELELQ